MKVISDEVKMGENNIILADRELKDLEDDYWACGNCTLPTTTVTRAIALAQLKRALECLQPYAEDNHSKVIITLDKTTWYTLCHLAGLQRER